MALAASFPPLSSADQPASRPSGAPARRIPAASLVAAADIGVVMATLLAVVAVRTPDRWPADLAALRSLSITIQDVVLLVALGGLVKVLFEALGLYEAARVRRWLREAGRAVVGATLVAAAVALVATTVHGELIDRAALVQFWLGSAAAVAAARAVRAAVTRSSAGCRRALIVGSGPHALRICRELSSDLLTSYRVLGFVDTLAGPRSQFVSRRTLGSLDQLEEILVREHVDEVHVGLPIKSHYPQIQETIRVCERVGVKLVYGADIFGTELAHARVDGAAGAAPRVELRVVTEGPAVLVKRALDVIGAAVLLALLAPLMALAALAVKLTSEGPVIFAQERYGLNRRKFRMLKFRTMVVNAETLQAALEAQNEVQGPMFKIRHDPRITSVGRWLRRTSIDELPQLVNVLRGDMSLIGPRPLPLRDVAQFTRSSDMRRFSVRPGLSGLWQVSGRRCAGFDEWVHLDLHYIDHWSLGLDVAILARTIPAVIRGTGAA